MSPAVQKNKNVIDSNRQNQKWDYNNDRQKFEAKLQMVTNFFNLNKFVKPTKKRLPNEAQIERIGQKTPKKDSQGLPYK
jgi:hypothetical protein